MKRRIFETLFVATDGFVVVAGEVVGVGKLEQGAGVGRIKLGGTLEGFDGGGLIAFALKPAGDLVVVLGAVAGEIFLELVQHRLRLIALTLMANDGGKLELDLAGVVA